MSIVDEIAKTISDYAENSNSQVYGQNLFKPGYIAGLGKFMVKDDGITPKESANFDATNSELTSVGYGIGRAIAGFNSLLIVKQQDFLYLAIDQLVNTTINCIGDDSPKGIFKIIVVVSDLPKEGPQAYSNNISLFSNLSPNIEINYCVNARSLETSLKSKEKPISISFLSSEYIYSSKLIYNSEIEFLDNKILELGNESDIFNIIIGFVPEHILRKLLLEKVYIPINLSELSWIDTITSKCKSLKIKNIVIHESSSSNFNFSEIVAWRIKIIDSEINVNINSHRGKTLASFSLLNQSKNY